MHLSKATSQESDFLCFVLENHSVYDSLFSCLSPGEIFRFRRVSKLAAEAVQSYLVRCYDINRHLGHFFDDPIAFRRCQFKTKALIAGSNALQFLDRTYYPEADLDVYVDIRFCEDLAEFMTSRGEYTFKPREGQAQTVEAALEPALEAWSAGPGLIYPLNLGNLQFGSNTSEYSSQGIGVVLNFVKQKSEVETLNVQLIAAARSPLDCILSFHSSTSLYFSR